MIRSEPVPIPLSQLPTVPKQVSNLNIPNALTTARVLAIPVFVYLLYGATHPSDHFWAAAVFGVASGTDFFDGRLARRMGTVTPLGKLLDPMADKLIVIIGLVMLVHLNFVNVAVAVLLITREIAINTLRSLAGTEQKMINPSSSGKAKVWFEGFGIGFLMLGPDNRWLDVTWMNLGHVLLYIALALALWSGATYCRDYFQSQTPSAPLP